MRRPVIDFGPLSQKWTVDIGGGGDSSGVQNPMGYSSQSKNSDLRSSTTERVEEHGVVLSTSK